MPAADLRSPYLVRGLIAYIGNKRALFPFLSSSFLRCAESMDGGRSPAAPIRFLDPFSGSGGVSRLGRSLGFSVLSNDREFYAAVIGRSRVVLSPCRLEAAFAAEGGSVAAFAALDAFARGADGEARALVSGMPASEARSRWTEAFSAASSSEPYIARHYAPRTTEDADWRSERLFYTAENARFLDRAREAAEFLFPGDTLAGGIPDGDSPDGLTRADAKAAILDALIYEAATRVNTSGVFKACHRGFGGHGGDALKRITSPMRLQPPDLVDGFDGCAGFGDAAEFCAAHPADIVYLDPPYNQHQYGSNYHLLNTVALWDKPPVPETRDESGFLLDRSGIRSDWVSTRSDFCRRGRASGAFEAVLDSIDARFILVSYSDGGIVPLERMGELLESRGSLRIESVPYVAYRGGKQSATRTERTSELLFIVDTKSRAAPSSGAASRESLRAIRAWGALDALAKERFDPRGGELPPGASVGPDGRLSLVRPVLDRAAPARLERLAETLRRRACRSNAEAFDLLLELSAERLSASDHEPAAFEPAARDPDRREALRLAREALGRLKKIAFRKYAAEYALRSARLRTAAARLEAAALLEALDELDARAALRGVAVPPREAGGG